MRAPTAPSDAAGCLMLRSITTLFYCGQQTGPGLPAACGAVHSSLAARRERQREEEGHPVLLQHLPMCFAGESRFVSNSHFTCVFLLDQKCHKCLFLFFFFQHKYAG